MLRGKRWVEVKISKLEEFFWWRHVGATWVLERLLHGAEERWTPLCRLNNTLLIRLGLVGGGLHHFPRTVPGCAAPGQAIGILSGLGVVLESVGLRLLV